MESRTLKIIHSTRVDVRRASHCHHTPQALRAQSGPVTRTINPMIDVSSAPATAIRSAEARFVNRNTALPMPLTNAAANIAMPHAA